MRYLHVAVAVALVALASMVRADWSDAFPGGTPQQSWTYAGLPNGSAFTQSYFSGGNQLSSTTAVGSGGSAAVFGWVSGTFSNSPGVRVRAVLNPNNQSLSQNIGVLAQLNPGLANAYSLTITYAGSNTVDITKNTGGVGTSMATGAIPNFNSTASYTVELDAIGTQITGRVYDSANTLLTTISKEDTSPFTSGFAGIVAQRGVSTATLLGTYSTVSAVAVPEPSSLVLAGFGCGAFGLYAWRRRRRLSCE